mmetsp:Transcript_30502/g.89236  ORF Transcript_30502/g.89236 Transcript_30502/m.89236 type:complete len:231 (-) Transcript_30502:1326-2018(-)
MSDGATPARARRARREEGRGPNRAPSSRALPKCPLPSRSPAAIARPVQIPSPPSTPPRPPSSAAVTAVGGWLAAARTRTLHVRALIRRGAPTSLASHLPRLPPPSPPLRRRRASRAPHVLPARPMRLPRPSGAPGERPSAKGGLPPSSRRPPEGRLSGATWGHTGSHGSRGGHVGSRGRPSVVTWVAFSAHFHLKASLGASQLSSNGRIDVAPTITSAVFLRRLKTFCWT